jgi:outer membrane protein assembly factor BamD (BamD/ComL family)
MVVVALCLVVILVAAASAQDSVSEQIARRQYRSGMAFLAENKVLEALKDFQAVVDSYPQSSVAGSALLQIAQCQLDAGEIDKAQAAVDRLQKFYSTSESGAMGLVLAGRIILGKDRTPASLEWALANYRRVTMLYPGSDAVPASNYYAGEALRLSHRDDEAIRVYRQVSTDYPESEWAPRALLGEARCLVATGEAGTAMDLLQRVREHFPKTPEAATALAWNTILYRLYVRAGQAPPFQFVSAKSIAGLAGRMTGIGALGISGTGMLYASTPQAVLVFDLAGKPAPGPAAKNVRAILFDRAGRPVLVCTDAVVSREINGRPLGVKKPDGTLRVLSSVSSGVLTSRGDILVTDTNAKNIGRFSSSGTYIGPFAAVFPERLAIDATDRIASIDQDGSGVSIFDHDGQARPKIPARGLGYGFGRPVDIAFDALGHAYVLDRDNATVWVFAVSPQPKLLTGFSVPPKSPGVFRRAVCFALDSAGRLYIYDEDAERIQVYQ